MNIREIVAGIMFSPLENWLPIQEAVAKLTGGPKWITVPILGGRMRYSTSEKTYWLRDSFEKQNRLLLESMLTKDSVFYDVGANAGFWEVALASRCKQIVAFEPVPANFQRLQEHVELNGLRNVVLVNAAVSERTGYLSFAEDGSMSHVTDEGPIQAPATSIDEFVSSHAPPSVAKIDVEGHAPQVLEGMSETLRRFHPRLLIELHDEAEERRVSEKLSEHAYQWRVAGRRYPRFAVA